MASLDVIPAKAGIQVHLHRENYEMPLLNAYRAALPGVFGVALAVVLLVPSSALAAEVKLLSAGAVHSTLDELLPQYERTSGNTVVVTYDAAGGLRQRLERGEKADVLILPQEALDDAAKRGWIVASTRRDLGTVGIGLAVRQGAPVPDITTPEALKRVLLDAKSVAYTDPTRGTSGRHFDSVVLSQLGIAAEVRPKARLLTEGSVGGMVNRGEAEVGVQQLSELIGVAGITVVGPLPASLQKTTTYTVVVLTSSASAALASQLEDFLTSSSAKAVFQSKGFANY